MKNIIEKLKRLQAHLPVANDDLNQAIASLETMNRSDKGSLTVVKQGETYSIEWFEETHVFDACGLSESDKAAIEKLKETYDILDQTRRAEMRGMLRMIEDGLTNGYLQESAETLARVWDLFQK